MRGKRKRARYLRDGHFKSGQRLSKGSRALPLAYISVHVEKLADFPLVVSEDGPDDEGDG